LNKVPVEVIKKLDEIRALLSVEANNYNFSISVDPQGVSYRVELNDGSGNYSNAGTRIVNK